jgi:hypothetical protein
MRKYAVIVGVSALALLSTAAIAQIGPAGPDGGNQAGVPAQSGTTRSGYQIPGCENYEVVGSQTRQVCNVNDTKGADFWRNRDKFNAAAPSGSN